MSHRRTKIVATVGPSSRTTERLLEMIEAGVDVFRLNFSHGDRSVHTENVEMIRDAAERRGMPVVLK